MGKINTSGLKMAAIFAFSIVYNRGQMTTPLQIMDIFIVRFINVFVNNVCL